ncbi:prepilin-type N-terminal cleavage/methylation domain-containing protein [Litorivivens sp.]|uniref:prepilin-type N-terminal cleavage/methylation domain-containing protein n=1 Tax=Litorivivens sp. TaxID=2020868 RepID=UPI003562D1DE
MSSTHRGFTLLELLLAVAISATLAAGLATIINQALQTQQQVEARLALSNDARFAMERIARSVRASNRLFLPLNDNPATPWRENVREQSIPAQPPESGSVLATAVLAISMDPFLDGDNDGWADANRDQDFYDFNQNNVRDPGEPERVDEDIKADQSNDLAAGIVGIDDNGDGLVDISVGGIWDDDEDGSFDEDPIDGIDNDGDGSIDEDPPSDMNGDGQGGVPGESCLLFICSPIGDIKDDDADGAVDEDTYNIVVYHLSGSNLIERNPSFPGANPTGAHFTNTTLAEGVSYFGVERLPEAGGRPQVVVTLELTRGNERIRLSNTLSIRSAN